MKILRFFLSVSFLILTISCSDNDNITPPKLEDGSFYGDIGRCGYVLTNTIYYPRMRTNFYDGENYQFEFYDIYDSIDKELVCNNALTVNLIDIFTNTSYKTFDTFSNKDNYNKVWVHLYNHYSYKNIGEPKDYVSIDKRGNLTIKILSTKYEDLRIPSIEGVIKGYLYNINNSADSIYINAEFITQASY